MAAGTTLLARVGRACPTVLWNESCSPRELAAALEQNGAAGAACDPLTVLEVLRREWDLWKDRIAQLVREHPEASETEIAARVTEEMAGKAAELLRPVFERSRGRDGRLAILADPKAYRNPAAILEQAKRLHRLGPNLMVQIPATRAGIAAIEEATGRGISVDATACLSLPQVLAVAAAVERGLAKREREGKDSAALGPVCTVQVGQLDDSLRCLADQDATLLTPGIVDWAGIAALKKACRLCRERGFRLRLKAAAFRTHLHWSEFVGGDLILAVPWEWQQRLNGSGLEGRPRMDAPVDPGIIAELRDKFPDFRRAYAEDGLAIGEFDTFGPVRRVLRQWCKGAVDLPIQLAHRPAAPKGCGCRTHRVRVRPGPG